MSPQVLQRGAKRLQFEVRIEVAGDAIGAELRANLAESVRDFSGAIEICAERQVFDFCAEGKNNWEDERALRYSALKD